MESSQPQNQSVHHRPTKFTPLNIRQIINLVERGTSAEQIAEIIDVTLGTLKTAPSSKSVSGALPLILARACCGIGDRVQAAAGR